MLNLLLVLPLVVPLTTAALCLLAWRSRALQRALAVGGAAALFGANAALFLVVADAGRAAVQVGAWPAPYGITLVADLLSALMLLLAGLMGLAIVVYSLGSVDRRREAFGYYPLLHVLLLGVCGAFLTGDLFNLYVWFEVMLMASFALLVLGGERGQLQGGVKYVALNLLSSAVFLMAAGLLYGMTGTLNLADLGQRLDASGRPGLVTALGMLFVVAFGIKAAVFPLFFWLPDSYHTPPVPVSALFSGLLTKVGVYALVRVFTLVFVQEPDVTRPLLLTLAVLTMVTGVLGAVAQTEVRRLLSFHIVSQIGYLLMGLGLFTAAGLAGVVLFMAHVVVAKSALFLVAGLAHRIRGTYDLKRLGGLYATHPGLATLFLLPALSLAGLPPLSGFVAKLALVRAGLDAGQYLVTAAALGVSLLTLFSMMKIWNEAFWKPAPVAPAAPVAAGNAAPLWLPTAALAALTVLIGLAAGPLQGLATRAAEQLLDRRGYGAAVLHAGGGAR